MSSRWTVGEVARAAGVTVRTLHHREQVGLLLQEYARHAGHLDVVRELVDGTTGE